VVATPDRTPHWAKRPAGIYLVDVAPSPDGKTIAFEYTDESLPLNGVGLRNHLGIGLLDWQTGKLTRIANPAGKQLSSPSFSYDGKRLLVGVGPANGLASLQIGEVNLTTMHLTLIGAKGPMGRMTPVYQPGTGNILFIKGAPGLDNEIVLLDRKTQAEKVILEDKNSFTYISTPWFIQQNEILFQAGGASYGVIHLGEELGRSKISRVAKVTYRLVFGGMPEFYSLEVERRAPPVNSGAFGSLSVSANGRILAFTSAIPERMMDEKGIILRELFKMEAGQITQLTNYGRSIMLSGISYNGSVVALVGDLATVRQDDLFIYKMDTGELVATGLLERIKKDSAFALE
jgi:hypothetical protein